MSDTFLSWSDGASRILHPTDCKTRVAPISTPITISCRVYMSNMTMGTLAKIKVQKFRDGLQLLRFFFIGFFCKQLLSHMTCILAFICWLIEITIKNINNKNGCVVNFLFPCSCKLIILGVAGRRGIFIYKHKQWYQAAWGQNYRYRLTKFIPVYLSTKNDSD